MADVHKRGRVRASLTDARRTLERELPPGDTKVAVLRLFDQATARALNALAPPANPPDSPSLF